MKNRGRTVSGKRRRQDSVEGRALKNCIQIRFRAETRQRKEEGHYSSRRLRALMCPRLLRWVQASGKHWGKDRGGEPWLVLVLFVLIMVLCKKKKTARMTGEV